METILRTSIKKASQCGIESCTFKIEFDKRSDMLLQASPEVSACVCKATISLLCMEFCKIRN